MPPASHHHCSPVIAAARPSFPLPSSHDRRLLALSSPERHGLISQAAAASLSPPFVLSRKSKELWLLKSPPLAALSSLLFHRTQQPGQVDQRPSSPSSIPFFDFLHQESSIRHPP
ncbi:unnamed protein product [Urochloa humidicola]